MKENEKKRKIDRDEPSQADKGRMFLKHCCRHPMDVLRLGKATVLYGAVGVKARAGELALNEWDAMIRDKYQESADSIYSIKFSIVMPVYNVDVKWLEKAVASVLAQKYRYWELCIVDDASTDPAVREYLSSLKDRRIRVKFAEENKGIAEASNAAAAFATGDYLLLMDNDDELHPEALSSFYYNLLKTNADIIYSDMDMIDENGEHSAPLYKPDWSPDLMLSQMYIGHLLGFKRELFKKCGGFRSEFNGAQDYDLFLRMTEHTQKITHVSKVLYSWRTLPTSTAVNADAKPYAQTAGQNAIQAYMDRVYGEGYATVCETENLFVYDVRYNLAEKPLVSIIIPTKDHAEDLKIAIDSIFENTSYDHFEMIVLDNHSEKEETRQYFTELMETHDNVRIVEASYKFNWSKLNNHGIREAKGDVFVFLNNDVKIIEPSWLERLAEQAVQPKTGAVGGLLLFEDGTIQHAGVVVGMGGWADHVYRGMQPVHQGTPFISPMVRRNVTAVTGACMAVSREVIEKIGGFDEHFIVCGSDVEICIRAIQQGYKNVYVPQVKLYHYESKTRDAQDIPKIDFELSDIMYSGYRKGGDPYYNRNLKIDTCIPEVKEEEAKRKFPKLEKVMLEEIRPLHFKKEKRNAYRLNLVLPSLNPEHVFGGIATALKCFEAIADRLDCDTRIILLDAEPNAKVKERFGKRYAIVEADAVSDAKHQIVPMIKRKKKTLRVCGKDQFMFTSWWTAYVIQNEYREWDENEKLKPLPFLYLIQDYEPGFYAWSSHYVLSEATYKCEYPQIAIFNSSELKEYVMRKGYHFTETYCFDPLLNGVLAKHVKELGDTVYKRKQILVYGRPNVERNAFEIVVESLKKWVKIQPDAGSWTILSAGEQHAPVYLGENVYMESVGKLSLEAYAKMLRESYAGISLMVSPHPSYPPLEMSVFDVKVITNTYSNKDISGFNENIVSVSNTSPTNIARELKKICSDFRMTVPHKMVNEQYVSGSDPFPFLDELTENIRAVAGIHDAENDRR